jgi:hypothetical protein
MNFVANVWSFHTHELDLGLVILGHENIVELLETFKILHQQQLNVTGVIGRSVFYNMVDLLFLFACDFSVEQFM